MDVRMPDGVVIQNVPEGTSKAELGDRYRQHVLNTQLRDESSLLQNATDPDLQRQKQFNIDEIKNRMQAYGYKVPDLSAPTAPTQAGMEAGPPEPEPPPEPAFGSTVKGLVRAGLKGADQGLFSTLGMPGDLVNAVTRRNKMGIPFPGSEDVTNLFKQFGWKDYDPQTVPEAFTKAGAKGAVSVLTPGLPGKAAQLAAGTLSGVGEEAVKRAMGDQSQGDQAGAAIGSAVPLIALSLLKSAPHLLPELLSKAVPGILNDLAKKVPYLGIAKGLLTQNAARPPIQPLHPEELAQ
jgi:hypothetical protein